MPRIILTINKKRPLIAFLTLASSTLSSYADSRFFYSSSGQFQGQAIESGNGYFFYNQTDQYDGQASIPGTAISSTIATAFFVANLSARSK